MLKQIGFHLSQAHNTLRFSKDNVLRFITVHLPPNITANRITLFRFIIVLLWLPLVILCPAWWQISIFFIVYFFDLLDGAVARYKKQEAHSGKYFDHISDRINHIVLYTLILRLVNNQLQILKFFIIGELFFIFSLAIEYFSKNKDLMYTRITLQFCIKIALWIALIWEINYVFLI